MTDEKRNGLDTWAIIELMGHQTIAGRLTEQEVAGTVMLRVDVPEIDGQPAFTRFIGGSAIYAFTPVAEDVARAAAASLRPRAVTVYMPPVLQLPAPEQEYDPEDMYDDADD